MSYRKKQRFQDAERVGRIAAANRVRARSSEDYKADCDKACKRILVVTGLICLCPATCALSLVSTEYLFPGLGLFVIGFSTLYHILSAERLKFWK
jgi:hypothetical protein